MGNLTQTFSARFKSSIAFTDKRYRYRSILFEYRFIRLVSWFLFGVWLHSYSSHSVTHHNRWNFLHGFNCVESYFYRCCNFTLLTSPMTTTKCVHVYKRCHYAIYGIAILGTRSVALTLFQQQPNIFIYAKPVNICKSKKKSILMFIVRNVQCNFSV